LKRANKKFKERVIMALTDINKKMPRLKLEKPMETRELLKEISERSGFTAGDVIGVIYALSDSLLSCCRNATPLRLEGMGLFSPTIKLDGKVSIRFKPDKHLLQELNRDNNLKNHITNRKNLGKTIDELKTIS
jgi:predicted histone-like DNA-binding protein